MYGVGDWVEKSSGTGFATVSEKVELKFAPISV